jgi:hypothetical protein
MNRGERQLLPAQVNDPVMPKDGGEEIRQPAPVKADRNAGDDPVMSQLLLESRLFALCFVQPCH